MVEAVNRMSQNVKTKAVRMTISLSSQDKIRRDTRNALPQKTAHRIALTRGPKDGRRFRAKGSHRRDGRSRRFQTVVAVVGSTSHTPACPKNVLITRRKYACQRRAISLKRLKFYRCQRGHHGSQDHISRQPVYLYPFALILFRSETGARLFAFFPLHLCLNVSTD